MIIILEGCDGAGKSTTAKAIADKFGFEVVRGSHSDMANDIHALAAYSNSLLERQNIVIDRFVHSNLVYASIMGKPRFHDEVARMFNRKMDNLHSAGLLKLLYLNPGRDVLVQRLSERGDEWAKEEHIDLILEGYAHVLNASGVPYETITNT